MDIVAHALWAGAGVLLARVTQIKRKGEHFVARAAKFFQSKGLARGKDVIDGDAAISSLPGLEFVDRRLQVRRAVVRPIDILKHHFGVGAFPQKEV